MVSLLHGIAQCRAAPDSPVQINMIEALPSTAVPPPIRVSNQQAGRPELTLQAPSMHSLRIRRRLPCLQYQTHPSTTHHPLNSPPPAETRGWATLGSSGDASILSQTLGSHYPPSPLSLCHVVPEIFSLRPQGCRETQSSDIETRAACRPPVCHRLGWRASVRPARARDASAHSESRRE